jgi:hypothetical protein
MKASLLFILVFTIFSDLISAQASQGNVPDSIRFEKTSYNYGTIQQGSSGECEFRFLNKGKNPLVLSNVNASCGCTTPEWPKSPVNPNEYGIIKVKYNTAIIGHFTKTIMVYSNAVNSPVVLQISGEVK